MQAEPPHGFRGFFQSTVGRVTFVLIAVAVTFAAFTYIGTLLAIPVMMIVGLAFPVWLGLKRPRFLAIAALVVLLAAAPLATIIFSQEILVAPASASSATVAPLGSGGSVLTDATLTPFQGTASTNFTWSVTLEPKYLPSKYNGTIWTNDEVQLYISTCPGATTASSSNCASGYPFHVLTYKFPSAPTNGTVVPFHHLIGTSGIWSWQMSLVIQNTTNTSNPSYIGLVGDPTYDGIEGPIIGGFATVYGALIGAIYVDEFVYLGLPFYFVLLLYMWYKSRERRRRQAIRRAARAVEAAKSGGTTPPASESPSPPASGGPAAAGAAGGAAQGPGELACPACGAVVYAGEAKCWKCGADLGGPKPAPLPSG